MSEAFFSPVSRWISAAVVGGPRTAAPVPYFRRSFHLATKPSRAELVITALGLYDAEINGLPVGGDIFRPGWTDYTRRVAVQRYDVTAQLRDGENVLGAILGDGWFCGHVGPRERQVYGDRPKLRAELRMTWPGGGTHTIATDGAWKTATGPILASDFMAGEACDARREMPGWSAPGFDDARWVPVGTPAVSDPEFVPDAGCPVRRIEEIRPAAMLDGHVVDFGQNFTGRVRLTVKARPGRTVSIQFAEVLDGARGLYRANLRSAVATDHYTCRSADEETWEPRFTFHGFRYAQVHGLAEGDTFALTGIVLHSDMRPTGSFSCSNPLLNQLQHNIIWGQKSNFLEVPTDCPQRDERLGWTGDAQVFVRTAAFNFDVQGFFRKWARDLRDAERPSGSIPAVVPNVLSGTAGEEGGPAWADATIICPWTIFRCYGDREILADHYASMKRFLGFLAAHRVKNFIRSHPDVDPWGGFGDWLALDGSGLTEGATPKDLIGTAFYAYDAGLMSEIAGVLGHSDDARHFRNLREKIALAFRQRFVTPEGFLASGTQTSYVLALHFGLLPEAVRANAARQLVRDIERRGTHLATGFVGTPYLLDVLEAHGHLDVAYRLLEQESFPSWLFPVKHGATTIWERWDGWTPEKGFQDPGMNSFNHYAYGAVGAWMYRTVAGLDAAAPGYKKILFRPRPGGTLTSAQAALETPHGRAAISWTLAGGALTVHLEIPAGTSAQFDPPPGFHGDIPHLTPGAHTIELRQP